MSIHGSSARLIPSSPSHTPPACLLEIRMELEWLPSTVRWTETINYGIPPHSNYPLGNTLPRRSWYIKLKVQHSPFRLPKSKQKSFMWWCLTNDFQILLDPTLTNLVKPTTHGTQNKYPGTTPSPYFHLLHIHPPPSYNTSLTEISSLFTSIFFRGGESFLHNLEKLWVTGRTRNETHFYSLEQGLNPWPPNLNLTLL